MEQQNVTIIGGGIIGLSIAFYLLKSGKTNITVVERGKVASEASHTNAGGIWPNWAIEPYGLREFASYSLRLFQELMAQDKLEFEFRKNGVIELIFGKENVAKRYFQIEEAKKAGHDISFLEPKQVSELEPEITQEIEGALYSPNDANASSSLLASELMSTLEQAKISVLENTEVEGINVTNRRITELITSKDVLFPDMVVNAAGPWSPSIGNMLGLKIPVEPAKGYILSTAEHQSLKITMAISDGDVVVSQQPDGRILIGGTVDFLGFDKAVDPEKVNEIKSKASRMVPHVSDLEITEVRAALRPHSVDRIPIVGFSNRFHNLVYATGHFRRGFELAPATGKVVAEIIEGKNPSVDISCMNPIRFNL